jgi:hypothetical protein
MQVSDQISAGASGTRDETTVDGGDGEGGEGNVRAAKKKRGTRAGKDRTGNRRAAAWRGKLMRIRTFYYLPPKAGFNWRGPARR